MRNALIVVSSLAVAAPALAAAPPPAGATVEIFVRKAGSPARRNAVEKENPQRFELDKLKLEEVKHGDVQYEAKLLFRGIKLAALLEQYKPPITADLALLHFANGMTIPLPFRDEKVMKRLDPFLARELRNEAGPLEFPPIAKKVENYVDVKPIVFTGNKIAVNSRLHPDVGEEHMTVFSPWIFVDTLLAIELVNSTAYYRQFAVSDTPEATAGWKVFQHACQTCHGARKLGASFGWDFVEPDPIASRKKPQKLFFHVHYRSTSEVMRGAQMPALSFVTEDDAKKLFAWLQAIADKPLLPYSP